MVEQQQQQQPDYDSISIISQDSDDDISEQEPPIQFLHGLNDSDIEELESTIEDLFQNYLDENFVQWYDPEFMNHMAADITELVLQDLIHAEVCDDSHEEELAQYIQEYVQIMCEIEEIPPRSEPHIFAAVLQENAAEKIEWLRNQPQPQQRTPEWYEFRHGLITASNIWKAFSTECQQNSLIYEKCQPAISHNFASVGSSLHWGVKYEPLSVMLYEAKMRVKIEDFGCIRHEKYDFIGASPDGIVSDPNSPLYGRMLEIKNIVNREIDGVPSIAYWIQMQLQMETCDLEACDFLETQIKEYETADEFWEAANSNQENDSVGKRGIVLMFFDQRNQPVYKFMPLNIPITLEDTGKWIKETEEENLQYKLEAVQYWYLEIYSCVTVRRNWRWFNYAHPVIDKIWKIVLKEREEGYEHRAPKKRVVKSVLQNYIVNKLEEEENLVI